MPLKPPYSDAASELRSEPGAPLASDAEPRTLVEYVARTPLLTKLILLDLAINIIVLGVIQGMPARLAGQLSLVSLLVVLILNAALVAWALRPLQVLENTARRVSEGEYSARASMPPLADRNLVRIGETLNALLDRLGDERARVRTLASQAVAAGEEERARIARELHDGTAQSLSALDMLMTSTLDDMQTGPARERLLLMKEIVGEALSEVRALSHRVHPRVLDDLGLEAALEWLARRTRVGRELEVVLDLDVRAELGKALSAVLYRVAQEATHNAVKHGAAETVEISLSVDRRQARLVVRDDGRGFDPQEAAASGRGMGLFIMEERVSLVDGAFELESRPGGGTVVRVSIPLGEQL